MPHRKEEDHPHRISITANNKQQPDPDETASHTTSTTQIFGTQTAGTAPTPGTASQPRGGKESLEGLGVKEIWPYENVMNCTCLRNVSTSGRSRGKL